MGCKTLSFCPKNRISFVSHETFAKKGLKLKKTRGKQVILFVCKRSTLEFLIVLLFHVKQNAKLYTGTSFFA